jgi:hypothetical protein
MQLDYYGMDALVDEHAELDGVIAAHVAAAAAAAASSSSSSSVPESAELASLRASRAVLAEAVTTPQEIKAHFDRPARAGYRMFKAIFMVTMEDADSFWDLYASDGSLICTLVIPSGYCLFASDFALGMLAVMLRR